MRDNETEERRIIHLEKEFRRQPLPQNIVENSSNSKGIQREALMAPSS